MKDLLYELRHAEVCKYLRVNPYDLSSFCFFKMNGIDILRKTVCPDDSGTDGKCNGLCYKYKIRDK